LNGELLNWADMLPVAGQYVNMHAHRGAADPGEWVLRSLKSSEYPGKYEAGSPCSMGIHPWEISSIQTEDALETLRKAVAGERLLAVGEVGLDKAIGVPADLQQEIFEAQVAIAEEAGLPVIIHAVRTYPELVGFSKQHHPSVPLIIHGFNGSRQLAEELVRHGFYLSFGESLVRSEKTGESFRALPSDRLFLETDESPLPVSAIYEAAAALKGKDVGSIQQQLVKNALNIFSGGE